MLAPATLDDHLLNGRYAIRAAMRQAVLSGDNSEVMMLVRRNLGYRILKGEIPVTLKPPVPLDDIAAQQAEAA